MAPRAHPAAGLVAQLRPTGTSQESVLAELRRVLVSGRVKPGTLLPLDAIARAFGVSRTPVREAMKTLLGEGLISHNHRGGYIVHALSRDEFVELYTIRHALEAAALALSAAQADAATHATVSESLARQRAALKLGDVAAWDVEGRAFHEALVLACGMPRLCRLIRDAANATGTTRPMLRLPLARIEHLHADHEAMAAAFVAGDVTGLQDAAGEHLRRVRAWLLDALDGSSV